MPLATERNTLPYRYTDNAGAHWTIRTFTEWGGDAASGLAAAAGDPTFGRYTRRNRPRMTSWVDPQSFRKIKVPVGTIAAQAAIVPGTTIHNFHVRGLQDTVPYTALRNYGEVRPGNVQTVAAEGQPTEAA